MTEKQKDYIKGLDELILDRGGGNHLMSEDILGKGWEDNYASISIQDASDCIKRLLKKAYNSGCYESDWAILNGYD